MDVIVEKGAGLDVHKETVVACIMGTDIKKEIRTFGTMTNDLLRLKESRITHIAMESTGVYWKPIFNILEDGFEVMLVNARHVKNVPGRKTDVKDSEWLCKQHRFTNRAPCGKRSNLTGGHTPSKKLTSAGHKDKIVLPKSTQVKLL